MSVLERIHSPADLRALRPKDLERLAAEIRTFLISNVSRTGGHLGPNLGVVELTIALHRVFDSPHDPIVFDTGHQSYVHKILTGRQHRFGSLRQAGGLSGYPSRAESPHDWVENSHASTALSWAEGMAKGYRLRGVERHVVAVVGDGALTGGMAWEALNNISVQDELRLVIVVNDNGRSYTPTVGGMASQLSAMRTDPRYEQTLQEIKRRLQGTPILGRPAYDVLHGMKLGLKDMLAPQGMFSDLGLKYIGPIDGHDTQTLERALVQAKNFGGPVIVHCMTRKGKGFKAAEDHEEDQFHTVGKIDAVTGEPLAAAEQDTWTSVFADELVRLGGEDQRVVALTAAMLHPTGLDRFRDTFPSRVFDVGIAEQHAVASAAGLATAGLHPVVALYATFLNRAFDQVLMDVALHRLGVTFVLDRAGITGPDGASHNGMWDMSILGVIPGLALAAPRDAARLRAALRTAVTIDDGPSVVRFPKAALPVDLEPVRRAGGVDLLSVSAGARVLLVGYGPMAQVAVDAGERLTRQGIAVTVADPIWVLPVQSELLALASEHELVVTIEDNGIVGGAGSRLAQELRGAGIDVPLREFGVPQEFLDHASRAQLLERIGLTAQRIALETTECLLRIEGHVAVREPAPASPHQGRSTPTVR